MKNNLLILGGGGHGQVVRETAEAMGCFDNIAFLDDNPDLTFALDKCSNYEKYTKKYRYAFVALGDNKLRKEWIEKLEAATYILPTIIHPTAYISPSANVYPATIIEAKVAVNTSAHIDKGCILSLGSIVDHNSAIGAYSHISCGAIVKAQCLVSAFTTLKSGEVFTAFDNASTEEFCVGKHPKRIKKDYTFEVGV